ncbi:MAG: DNA replication/repair protein RecF [Alphaproteobacteria bacterium]
MRSGLLELRLSNFRSYKTLCLKTDEALSPVVLTGANGVGKTNILEAISFLTPGRGLRQARLSDIPTRNADDAIFSDGEAQMLNWAVSAKVKTPDGIVQVGTGKDSFSEKRQIRIDGENVKTQSELGNVLSAIWVTPAQDRLFCGDPAARRRFLDRLVQAFDAGHANISVDYAYALKQWNNLLHEGRKDEAWLSALEDQIASNGVAIAAARRDIVARLSQFLSVCDVDGFPTAEIHLSGIVEEWLDGLPAVDVEDKFKEKLRSSRHLVADGGSVVGVHTSDFSVLHKQKNMDGSLCSSGEQKALLYSIVLAQTKAQMQEKGRCPILLLDELAAHFDSKRRDALLERLYALPAQVWMTGTDAQPFSALYGKAEFFNIENATLQLLKVA